MRRFFSSIIKTIPTILEFFISIMLTAGVVLTCIKVGTSIGNINDPGLWPNYDDLIEICLNLIIGVELISMTFFHTANTVFEVLIFALARQIIINHSNPWGTLIGVVAIAVLFATKKFLFSEFDDMESATLTPTMKARTASRVFGVHIPFRKSSDTVLDVFTQHCKDSEVEINEGAEVFFDDFGLRALKIRNGQVTKMELIRLEPKKTK